MIKRPAHNVKLIIKGPRANTSLQALLNTYKEEFLHSLQGEEKCRVGDRGKEKCCKTRQKNRGWVSVQPLESRGTTWKVQLTDPKCQPEYFRRKCYNIKH